LIDHCFDLYFYFLENRNLNESPRELQRKQSESSPSKRSVVSNHSFGMLEVLDSDSDEEDRDVGDTEAFDGPPPQEFFLMDQIKHGNNLA
jgi:hypothetical protein